MGMTFVSFIEANAKKYPTRTAVICEDRTLTYKELHERSNCLGDALRKCGIKKGDKVALYMLNCIEFIEATFAVSKIGAVVVPIGFLLTPREIHYILDNSDSVAVIFSHELLGNVMAVKEELTKIPCGHLIMVGGKPSEDMVAYEELLATGKPNDLGIEVNDEDDFYIGYTAGTTGFPKGAVFTHRVRALTLLQFIVEYGFTKEDRYLCPGPLYHAAPYGFTLVHLFIGAQVILMKMFDPVGVLAAIQKHQCTTSFMVPTMYNMILNLPPEKKNEYDVSLMRVLISAAAPLPTKVKEGILDFFPNAGLHEFYGSTEAGLVTNLQPEDQLRKVRSVGLPISFVDVKILDENGMEMLQGREGLIYIKAPGILKEYYKNTEATQAAFSGRWFTNQDIGRLDEEGYLYIVDRKADMVISGGVNIYPTEIEEVLIKHPKILEVAVIGVPNEKWGETILACIVPKPGMTATLEEITTFCEDKLAKYKIPKLVEVMNGLPKSPAGKILKRILREPFWKDKETRV